MTADTELRVLELRDSVAWAAGQSYERRRITLLRDMPGPTPRSVIAELGRLADQLDEAA